MIYMSICFVYFRCVVFNNRGVCGEMLLVRIKRVSTIQSFSVIASFVLSAFRKTDVYTR